jgi:plasmid stability protein
MKALTIRNVPEALAVALEREKARRGLSLNRTVIELLSQGLGIGIRRSNGLGRLAGAWNEDDLRRFEQAVAPFHQVDSELWK